MFDASNELDRFYNNHVRLGTTLRNDLANYRDLNLRRITDGLKLLGDTNGSVYKTYVAYRNQGSYAMHTLNQCEHTDYDIDVAVIFEKADLPDSASNARIRVREALQKKTAGTNFTKEPDARKNAVTVWYEDGYHIDFAIYRRYFDAQGNIHYEHAGGEEWTERDPMAFTNWFENQVTTCSPPTAFQSVLGSTVNVPAGQLRRITRLVKAFARSRPSWALPGGIVISALVNEVYKQHPSRDDVALIDTLRALSARLKVLVDVENPVQRGTYFTNSPRRRREVERLRDELEAKLQSFDVLDRPDCTAQQAMSAWNAIFSHSFWSAAKNVTRSDASESSLDLQCWLARQAQGTVYKLYRSGSLPLPKGLHLRFTARPLGISSPYQVRWSVRNEGHEASEDGSLAHDTMKNANEPYWTSTAYQGRHKLICEVIQNGSVVNRGEYVVRIAPGRRLRY